MNYLALDYGTKRIGTAVAVNGIISPLPVLKNDRSLLPRLTRIIEEYRIQKIYIGLSEGEMRNKTQKFVARLSAMLQLPIETVEEAVSTIEATDIYLKNNKKKKDYKQSIDSLAAAVILQRVLQ